MCIRDRRYPGRRCAHGAAADGPRTARGDDGTPAGGDEKIDGCGLLVQDSGKHRLSGIFRCPFAGRSLPGPHRRGSRGVVGNSFRALFAADGGGAGNRVGWEAVCRNAEGCCRSGCATAKGKVRSEERTFLRPETVYRAYRAQFAGRGQGKAPIRRLGAL